MGYYYLISGLPDLALDMDTRHLDFAEIYETITRNLEEKDQVVYRYLLYPQDNANLLAWLFEESTGRSLRPFATPSTLTAEEIRNYRHQRHQFPAYLNQFLEIYADQAADLPLRTLTSKLDYLFREEVDGLGDDFISSYFEFEQTLQDLLATYHENSHSFLSKPEVLSPAALLKHIGPNKTIPAMLARAYPYLETLVEALETGNPVNIERAVDHIRWTYLDGFQGFFGAHQVYIYTLRLKMVQRWHGLRDRARETDLQWLTDEISKISRDPKTVQL